MNIQDKSNTSLPVASMIVRGKIITDDLIEVGGRGGDLKFLTPDSHKYLDLLPLGNPGKLGDLYELSFEDILDYLEELGSKLHVSKNEHLKQSRALSYLTAPTTPPLMDAMYDAIPLFFRREHIREAAEKSIGIPYLEGWVNEKTAKGSTMGVRCFGARALHIVAGNSPTISVSSIIRNAVLRSDMIIKAPSNDPFTAAAIAHTMVDMAPDHPITKHVSVAYWRGGDVEFEEKLYRPQNIEKIVAWGGFASVKHVTKYIQPGLELISLDPKRSMSVVGKEAFKTDEDMREAAVRVATDIGALNQNGCINARVIYALCGSDDNGIAKLNRFGQLVYDEMLNLPEAVSTKPKRYDADLKDHVDALRMEDDWYNVIGGQDGEGAIIISRTSDPVEFATMLNDRTANLVPVDSIDEVLAAVNSYTQTVGVYPEELKQELLNVMSLYGAQRFVSLGYAANQGGAISGAPQDGIELMRRMGKWITNENSPTHMVPPLWKAR